MTNENTDGMSEHADLNEHDGRYALLCAYVLGEVSDAERAQIEAALASSPELRAEKARIESTIGLVQTALVKDEALSPRVRDEVLRAALPPVARAWWQESWVRAAAGILFVSFALGGWSIYETRRAAALDCAPEVVVAERGDATKRAPGSADARPAGQPIDAAVPGEARRDLAAASTRVENTLNGRAPATQEARPQDQGGAAIGVSEPGSRGAPAPKTRDKSELAKQNTELGDRVTRDAERAKTGELVEAETQVVAHVEAGEPGRRLGDDAKDDEVTFALFDLDDFDVETAQAANVPVGGEKKKRADRGEYRGPGDAGPTAGSPAGPTTGKPSAAAPGSPPAPGRSSTGGSGGDTSGFVAVARGGGKANLGANVQPSPTSAPVAAGEAPAVSRGGAVASGTWLGVDGFGASPGAKNEDVDGSFLKDSVDHDDVAGFGLTSAPTLDDEDRFILAKLGMPSAGLSAITPEVRARYRDEYVTDWCGRILRRCRPQPNERPRDMFFRFWGDNAFEFAAVDALSTFSADVDTASYALARRMIEAGHLPVKEQVRTEEFVNYFKADAPAPTSGTFAIQTTLAPSRFGAPAPGELVARPRDLLRVVVRGKDVAKAERKPLALTFVVDCSGSMKEDNRIDMVKHAMRLLVSQLDARDSIAIVKFSTDAALVLPMTSARDKALIESAIQPLAADGSTNSEAGLRMGYGAALAGLDREATNRVVFLSDGVANVGVTDANVIADGVKQIREQGIYLNTIGVGMANHNDVLLEQLADKGDGVCNYVDSATEAKKVFVDDFMGAVETIARDVKIQVEFDPAQVYRYRLLGYENRAVADADFRNDKVDAGEVGAGHQVTALYEIEYARAVNDEQIETKLDGPRPIATVRVRYKAPRVPGATVPNEEASEIARTLQGGERTSWEGAGPGYRRATLVAQFAEFLRRSYHARSDSYDQMLVDARKLATESSDTEFAQLVTLMEKAKALILNGWPGQHDELALAIDKVRENCVLRAQLERVAQERDRAVLAELETQNRQLEERLRELLRNRLAKGDAGRHWENLGYTDGEDEKKREKR